MATLQQILTLLPIMQAFFFMLIFLFSIKQNSRKFLFLYMLFMFIGLLTEFLAHYLVFNISVWSYFLSIPSMLCVMPAMYLYIATLTKAGNRFLKFRFAHYIPAILILLTNLVLLLQIPADNLRKLVEGTLSSENIDEALKTYIYVYRISLLYVYNFQMVFYSALLIIMLFRHRKRIKEYFSYQEKIQLKWLTPFVAIVVFFSLSDFFESFVDLKNGNPEIYSAISFIYISLVGYATFRQEEIYPDSYSTDDKKPANELILEDVSSVTFLPSEPDEFVISAAEKLKQIMEDEKLYLNPQLTLDDLSDKLELSRNTVSKIINTVFKMNFFSYINSLRIDEAVKLMHDSRFNHYSIEGIAKSVGFNSKSVFNPAFKNIKGVTPSEYRKNLLR